MEDVLTRDEAKRNLATNVNWILHCRGLKQEDAAEASGVHKMTLSRVCRAISLVDAPTIGALGELFGYTIDDLIGDPAVIRMRESLCTRREKSLTVSA